MNVKDNKGSITIFVIVGLLFMTAFLMISYASILNKSKVSKEQFNIISNIYSYNDSDTNAYERAYTALRKKKAKTLTKSVENSNSLELTKTFNESLSGYKIYGNTIKENNLQIDSTFISLPKGYQEVEYIESTGTQYIDTNLYGNINLTADIDIEIEDKNNSPIIGTDNFEWSKEYVCQAWNNALYCFKSSSSISLVDNTRLKIHLDPSAQSTIENIGSINSGMTEIANTKIYIAKWGSDLGSFKLYSCKFYENEVLVRDFVPCYRKLDNVGGLFDRVNNVFYTNSGTGTFFKGEEIKGYKEVEYIESTGTQYIDTNWYPKTNNARVKLKYVPINTVSKNAISGSENTSYSARWLFVLYGQTTASNIYPLIGDWNNASDYFESPVGEIVELDWIAKDGKTTISSANKTIENSYTADISTHKQNLQLFQNLTNQKSSIRLYYYKIYDNDVLVRDFVPCYRISDDVVGLYDKVNDVFYTNQGTGDFKAGDVVQKRVGVGDLVTDTGDSNFGKYKISIKVTNEDEVSKIYDIYLDKNLGTGEYIDFKNGKVVRNGSEEKIKLPKIFSFDDYTKIEVLTENIPSKIEVEYLGYSFEENSEE